MNLLSMKENKTYQRKSDGRFFKIENKRYYAANDKGTWVETTELSLADELIEKAVNFKKSLKDLYTDYKTGDVTISGRAFDQLLLRLCTLGDNLEKSAEAKVTKKKTSKKKK